MTVSTIVALGLRILPKGEQRNRQKKRSDLNMIYYTVTMQEIVLGATARQLRNVSCIIAAGRINSKSWFVTSETVIKIPITYIIYQ